MEAVLRYLIDHFPNLMDINLTATVVILFVICMRQFLKGAPKIFSYALWGIVLLRLLVPVSIESSMSFVPERTEFSSMVEVNEVLPEIQFETLQDRVDNEWYLENTPQGEPLPQVRRVLTAQDYLTFVWLFGIGVMLLSSFVCYWKLRRKLRVVIPYKKGIWIADDIDTPFVMGLLRPKIYLPGNLEPKERKYIIAHERHHIRRGDHIFKALGFLALAIHWFNPFVWAAFVLAGRDMEMSCDEAVIRKLGPDIRADYSVSLLNLATGHRQFSLTPLAFGEGNTSGRVRNLAKWKKPAVWVILLCLVLCVVLAVCLLTDPETVKPLELPETPAKSIEIVLHNDPLPEGYYEMRDEEGNILFTDGTDTVGGVLCYSIPEGLYDPDDHIEVLLYRMGIPDYMDTSLYFRGGMTSGDNGWLAEFESDVPEGEEPAVYRRHHFSVVEDLVYDIWFDMLLVDYETAEDIRLCVNLPAEPEFAESVDWGVSLVPDRVSRTGATALFTYGGSIPGEEGAELTYGDFLSLDRRENGTWVSVPELEGFDYYVGDSSYPVVDGYGMVHEWPDRFGELPDGHYRLGKQVTLLRKDGSTESRLVYGEFILPDAIRTGPIPLEELPENYSAEQAAIDGCLVCPDGIARDNIELFREFADACNRAEAGFFRVMYYYYGDDPHYLAYDIHYDGNKYTVNGMTSGDGRISVFECPYLKHFTGTKEREEYPYDAYEYYCFVGDPDITWQEIFDGQYEGKFMPILLNHIYYSKQPKLPDNPTQATLEFEGEALVTVTDFDRLEKIWLLFENAEYLGYEPKTHSIGVDLNLVLLSQSGETLTIELNPDGDTCRINGEYVFYGAFDEPDYIEKLWYYLGIEAWPDAVYEKYPRALKPEQF